MPDSLWFHSNQLNRQFWLEMLTGEKNSNGTDDDDDEDNAHSIYFESK